MYDYSALEEFSEILEQIYGVLYYGYNIAELGIAGIMVLIGVISAIVTTAVAIIKYFFEAIPLFVLSKKVGIKLGWLTWVPVFSSDFRMYVLSALAGEKEFRVFQHKSGRYIDKLAIRNRNTSFWVYLGIRYLGNAAITTVIVLLGIFIPGFGQIFGAFISFFYFIPKIILAAMQYTYLRDAISRFKPDTVANGKTSLIIVILDFVFTFGLARSFYLYTLFRCPVYEEETSRPVQNNSTKQKQYKGGIPFTTPQPDMCGFEYRTAYDENNKPYIYRVSTTNQNSQNQ